MTSPPSVAIAAPTCRRNWADLAAEAYAPAGCHRRASDQKLLAVEYAKGWREELLSAKHAKGSQRTQRSTRFLRKADGISSAHRARTIVCFASIAILLCDLYGQRFWLSRCFFASLAAVLCDL